MRKPTKLICLTSVLLAFCVTGAPAAPASKLARKVDAYLAPLVESHMFSGVVLVAKGGEPLVRRSYGSASYELGTPLKPDARFRIASITKTFTGAAVVILAERGRLSLEDPLSKYAPEFPGAERIQLRHLLLHRSGVPNPDIPPCSATGTEELVADLAKKPLWFEPGKGSRYSNGGYALLAYVIEKVTKTQWEAALGDLIFRPLGMSGTMRDADEPLVPARAAGYIPGPGPAGLVNATCQNAAAAIGSGALLSTAGDLARWGRAMAREELFKRAALEHPYGWGVRQYHDRPAIEQSGIMNGFASYLCLYPDDDLYVVLLSNVQTGRLTEAGIGLAGLALGKTPSSLITPPATVPSTAEQRKAWLGRWKNDDIGTFLLVERDGALYKTWEGASTGSYVFPTGTSTAYERQEDASLERDGAVIRISFGGGKPVEFRKQP